MYQPKSGIHCNSRFSTKVGSGSIAAIVKVSHAD
jgi:hypothetical protein